MSAIKQLLFSLQSMKLEKAVKVIRTSFYLTCLFLFLVWLANAVENYVSKPTTTKVTLKYGDDNKKNATFPSLTFCKLPMRVGPESKLWKGTIPCVNNSVLSNPYFLSYLEVCLESGINETVSELIKKVTYDVDEVLVDIQTLPTGSSPLKTNDEWKSFKDSVVWSTYHYNYGHCITIHISSLSKNNGLFPMEYENRKFQLYVNYRRVEETLNNRVEIYQFYFIHDDKNINLLGKDVESTQFLGGDFRVSAEFSIYERTNSKPFLI